MMKRKVYSKQMRKRSQPRVKKEADKTSLPKVDVLIKGHGDQAKRTSQLGGNQKSDATPLLVDGREESLASQASRVTETPLHVGNEAMNVANSQTTGSNSVQPEPGRVLSYVYPPTSYNLPAKELTEYPPQAEYSSYGSITYTALQAVGPLESQTHNVAHGIEEYGPQHWDQENTDRFHPWRLSDGYPLASVHPNYNHPGSYSPQDTYSQADSHSQSESRVSTRRTAGTSKASRRRRKRLQTPVQRSAANMRERRRMCHLNVAFDLLKDRLPNVKDKKKLSRIQTLKAAIYYIHLLRDTLNLQ